MYHWVKSKNLPITVDNIKAVTNTCPVCSEIKPRFHQIQGTLIKATAPFERLNLDFKGPLPSNTRNKYILTVVDEFSRFPFALPCTDVSSASVIAHLQNLFSIFGMPAYIHSDRGSAFMSCELKSFLSSLGIATSRTTAYNPRGNGQVERYNGIIWKTVQLSLNSKKLPIERWEEVLQQALHSIRSLLCTAINCTPHERMFSHPRRSFYGSSVPTWLSQPGPVLMRNHIRNKYEPIVQQVDLIEANPSYAFVRLPDGRETSVSLRHLAPTGDAKTCSDNSFSYNENLGPEAPNIVHEDPSHNIPTTLTNDLEIPVNKDFLRPRRQLRQPSYLNDYITD